MRYLYLLLLPFFITACSLLSLDGSENISTIQVDNDSESRIWVWLVEETVLHVVDPAPYIDPEDAPFPSIDPMSDRRFQFDEIESYERGDNIGILIYAVADSSASSPQPVADFAGVVIVSHDELRNGRWQIKLGEDDLFSGATRR